MHRSIRLLGKNKHITSYYNVIYLRIIIVTQTCYEYDVWVCIVHCALCCICAAPRTGFILLQTVKKLFVIVVDLFSRNKPIDYAHKLLFISLVLWFAIIARARQLNFNSFRSHTYLNNCITYIIRSHVNEKYRSALS